MWLLSPSKERFDRLMGYFIVLGRKLDMEYMRIYEDKPPPLLGAVFVQTEFAARHVNSTNFVREDGTDNNSLNLVERSRN